MKKIMVVFNAALTAVLTVLILIGCKDLLPPLPPGIDKTIRNVDTSLFDDINSNDQPDRDIYSSLLVATIKGYNFPQTGRVVEFSELTLDVLSRSSDNILFGSDQGSDTTLAVVNNSFAVVGRFHSKSVYFLRETSENIMTFDTFTDASEELLNFQDMVYNSIRDEYVLSALSQDELIILKNGVFKRQKITDDVGISPARMRVVGDKIYLNLQYLNDQWKSDKGVMAVIDMNDYSAEFIELGLRNPIGKIEYNPYFDRDHIYTTCAGTWSKRDDGGIVRVNLNTHRVQTVLRESEEEGSLLDVDFTDISIASNGNFYIIAADNNENWINKLYLFSIKQKTISEVETGVNGFGANPMDYSYTTDTVYYWCDKKEKTFLKARNVGTDYVKEYELDTTTLPASIKVWYRDTHE